MDHNQEYSIYYCILPHITEPSVLMLQIEGRWYLPHVSPFDYTRSFFPEDIVAIREALDEAFNIEVTVLRHIEDVSAIQICELENHSPTWCPPANGRWIGYSDLTNLEFAIREHRAVLQTWFSERQKGELSTLTPPWEQRGWFNEVKVWIGSQISQLGYDVAGPITQLKGAWSRSSILYVPTTVGNLYFKACFEMPPSELEVICLLAERWPDNVPSIVVMDLERRWMLMRDFGDKHLDNMNDDHWHAAVRLFAEIQMDSVREIDRWVAIGCRDLRPTQMIACMNELFADTMALTRGRHRLAQSEIASLYSFLPQLEEMCRELSNSAIPLTIHHEDFRSGNTVMFDETYLYYDWGNTVVSHPFFSINYFLNRIRRPRGMNRSEWILWVDDPRRCAIRDAYLQPWTRYEPMECLLEAFTLTRRLFSLYEAIRCYFELPYLDGTCPWGKGTIEYIPRTLREVLHVKGVLQNNNAKSNI